jgi:protein-S-isoprenylcysteine O-methyltransferase Ste14
MRWSNIPVPEGHLIPLTLGILLQVLFPHQLWHARWLSFSLGVPMLLTGILLAGWSVYTVREIDIEAPEHVISTGPFAISRNPMYLAWSLIYLASVLLANSIWLLMPFPLVLIYTHIFVILPEEKRLANRFGTEYLEYQSRVRRYF